MPPKPTDRIASDPANPTVTMIVGDSQIDRRVLDQARTLQDAGCGVTVLAGPAVTVGEGSDEASYPDLKIVRIDPSQPVESYSTDDERLPEALRNNWSQLFDHHDHFLELAIQHEAGIYTAHDLPQLPAAAIAAATTGGYLVFDAHELFPERQFFPPRTVSFLQDLERQLVPLADIVITVNKSIAEVMAVRYAIDVPQVVLNCPAVHTDGLVTGKGDEIRTELGLDPSKKILLFQGGLHDNRNLQNLVPAMSLVESEEVVLVLMGNGGLRPQLEEAAQAAGLLNERVYFVAAVPQRDLLRYTASADCGIIPYPHVDLNTYFCTPNKLFEFMVAGLPILANDSPELNRFVEQQEIGLNLPMRSAGDIASAIDAFFRGNLEMWRRNVKELGPLYTWTSESERFLNAYEMLAQSYPVAGMRGVILGAKTDYRQGEKQAALAKLESIMNIDPHNTSALNLLARISFDEGEFRSALTAAQAVLAQEASNSEALQIVKEIKNYTDRATLLKAM